MKLTARLLRKLVESEKQKMTLHNIFEAGPTKVGGETADVEGNVDIKKMADALGADVGKLKTAVSNLRAGKRNSLDNSVFGDIFAKLMQASPEDTVKAMNVLKKVSSEDGEEKKK